MREKYGRRNPETNSNSEEVEEMLKFGFRQIWFPIVILLIGMVILPLALLLLGISPDIKLLKIPLWAYILCAIALVICALILFGQMLYTNGGGGNGPGKFIPTLIFLFSLSIFIWLILLTLFHPQKFPQGFYEICTLWSAVYGSVLGTYALIKSS